MQRKWVIVTAVLASWLWGAAPVAAQTQLLGPAPYLSQADSPWLLSIAGGQFHLETFEDGMLDTPGVTAGDGSVHGPHPLRDSVDGDDGSIDGSGTAGHSWFVGGSSVTFTFHTTVLGGLPTHAGIVWTDGNGPVEFEAFDGNGLSLGIIAGSHSDGSFAGGTAEDRFYGALHAGGISRITLRQVGGPINGIDMDHLQYGRLEAQAVPEPGSLILFLPALLGFALLRSWRGGERK